MSAAIRYRLQFLPSADKEWQKLTAVVRQQFAKKLQERLTNPHLPAARLFNLPNGYKIKLRAAGYRLVYKVYDDLIVVQVIAVGKCERNLVYKIAARRA